MARRKTDAKNGEATDPTPTGGTADQAGRDRPGRVSDGSAMVEAGSPTADEQTGGDMVQAGEGVARLVVAIGASAGGLESLKSLFAEVPADSGIAFVVITHARHDRESLLPELLGRTASIPVETATDGAPVAPNRVLVGDEAFLDLEGGVIRAVPARNPAGPDHHPVDHFFRSLAQDRGESAVGVVLSGSGNDGALGIRELKAHGGMTVAQDPDEAKYDGMPRSAIGTRLVDHVLPVAGIVELLVDYGRRPRRSLGRTPPPALPDRAIHAILVRLRAQTGHDFTFYKQSTMARRIQRRLDVNRIEDLQDYLAYVRQNPRELDILLKELLISVTSFFRDPESWSALADQVERVLSGERHAGPWRAWVSGCATGEEAYTLAILLDELLREQGDGQEVQVFATDLDRHAVEVARAGLYPAGIAADVSAERLQRYFTREDGAFRVQKKIRDMVVFAEQNVVSDPPFSRLDLVVCRNLLIYLSGDAQRRLLARFHYGLRPGGLLFLGSSETITGSEDFFAPLDNRHKVVRRSEQSRPAAFASLVGGGKVAADDKAGPGADPVGLRQRRLGRTMERLLLDRLVPCTAVVNERGTVVFLHGETGRYFQPEQGEPRNDLLEMARDGLRLPLASALRTVRESGREACQPRVRVRTNGDHELVDVTVRPLNASESVRGLLMVTVERSEDTPTILLPDTADPGTAPFAPPTRREADLEGELKYARDSLQATIDELETSNQELKSSNEELQSTNEELQSSNEELQTSREEMQSLNEELNTVNEELKTNVVAMSRSQDDLSNLLNSMDVAAIFLDDGLRVNRFTTQARQLVRLIESDLGRPLADLTSSLEYPDLIADCRQVLETLVPRENEVRDHDGRHYLVRILPYRTADNVVDGVVLTIIDIDRARRAEIEAASREFFESMVQTVREPLLVLDGGMRVVKANRAFCRTFGTDEAHAEGCDLGELGDGAWGDTGLRQLLDEVLPEQRAMTDHRIDHDFPGLGRRTFLLNALVMSRPDPDADLILLSLEDATGRTT